MFAAEDVGGIVAPRLAFLQPEALLGLAIFDMLTFRTPLDPIHHDQELQELSSQSLEHVKLNPDDKNDTDHVLRTIRDLVHRVEIYGYPWWSLKGGRGYLVELLITEFGHGINL